MKMKKKDKSYIEGVSISMHSGENHNRSVLFSDGFTTLVGKNGIPDLLLTTLNFERANIPKNLNKNLSRITKMHVSVNPSYRFKANRDYFPLPDWLKDFSKLEFLGLSNFEISDLSSLANCPLNTLQMTNVRILDIENVIIDILAISTLELFIYDSSCVELMKELSRIKEINLRFQDYNIA